MDSVTFAISLDTQHCAVLEQLAAEQGLSKSALLRQGLRLYQQVHSRAKQGQSLAFRNTDGSYVPQVVVGLPSFE